MGQAVDKTETDPLVVSTGGDAVPDGEEPSAVYICRAAIAPIKLPDADTPRLDQAAARAVSQIVSERIRRGLENDPRVAEVYARESTLDVDNARIYDFFEAVDAGAPSFPDSFDRYRALRLNDPIEFRVRVPRKNQPRYRSLDDVPADEYEVYWDGISVLVQWWQEDPSVTGSGGHIVLDILAEIGSSVGYPVDILACAPGCLHRFIHLDFVTFDATDHPDRPRSTGHTSIGTTITMPWRAQDDARKNLNRNVLELHRPLLAFAEAKTVANEIEFLEHRIRADSEDLLSLAYVLAGREPFWPHFFTAIGDRLRTQGTSHASRRITAGVWLALATVDSDLALWHRLSEHLTEALEERKAEDLADGLDVGAAAFRHLDLSLARDALGELATRRDGRVLAWATLAGAAAALAGTSIAALLT